LFDSGEVSKEGYGGYIADMVPISAAESLGDVHIYICIIIFKSGRLN
jgi:hypothetical protein